LDRRIEDVDVDVASCGNSLGALLTKIQQKANCKIYSVSHEAIEDGILKTSERYCIAKVCTCTISGNPYDEHSTWHAVLCEIAGDGRISLVFNPDQHDQRRNSVGQFPVVGKLFFVKANPRA
jgi:hypothetical protein